MEASAQAVVRTATIAVVSRTQIQLALGFANAIRRVPLLSCSGCQPVLFCFSTRTYLVELMISAQGMNEIKSNWFVAFLGVICLCGSAVCCDDVSKAARKAWEAVDSSRVLDGAIIAEKVGVSIEDGKRVRTHLKLSMFKSGTKVLGKMETIEPSGSVLKEVIEIRNHKGVFVLEKKKGAKSWLLHVAERKDRRLDDILPERAVKLGFNRQYRIDTSAALYTVMKSKEAVFSNFEEFEAAGKRLVKFSLTTGRDIECSINAGKHSVVVDPEKSFRVLSCESVVDKFRLSMKFSYDDQISQQLYSVLDSECVELPLEKAVYTDQLKTLSHSTTPPADELFELTHYGLRDVVFPTEDPSYIWTYGICIILACVCFIAYVLIRRNGG